MKWYLAKMVYQIICGKGDHTVQFDEQLRLITARNEDEAFEKATAMGKAEQESFINQKNELVQWQFINIPELYRLNKLVDGTEIYSRINEVDNAAAYTTFVHGRAEAIRKKKTLLN